MTIFHHWGKTFFGKLQIIQIQSLNSTSAVIPYIEKYKSYNINDYIPPLRQDYSRKLQIIKIQWLHSSTAASNFREIYKLYKFNDSIPPLRQTYLPKISHYANLMTLFHLCGYPLQKNIQIIQHEWLHSTNAARTFYGKLQIIQNQWQNSTCGVIPS